MSYFKKWVFQYFVIAVLFCGQSFSEDSTMEEGLEYLLFIEVPSVVTSTMTKKSAIQAPSTMTVYSEADIKDMGARTLLELLEMVPGMNVHKNGYGISPITFRGISQNVLSDKIKLLVNGHSVSEPMWGDFSQAYNMPLENVKQIELIRGPGSSLYGANAFVAIINVILKTPEENKGTSADVKYGSFGTFRGDASYAYANDKKDGFTVNYNHSKTDGPDNVLQRDALSNTPFSAAPSEMDENDQEDRLFVNMTKGGFQVDASYVDKEAGAPVGQYYMSQDHERRYIKTGYIDAKYTAELSESFKIKAKGSYDGTDFEMKGDFLPNGFIVMTDSNQDGVYEFADLNRDGRIEYWPTGAYYELGYKTNQYKTELLMDWNITDKNELLMGVFYEKEESDDLVTKAEGHPLYLFYTPFSDWSSTVSWNKEADRTIKGVFFQDEWTIRDNLYLILGGRYDDYSDVGTTTNPRTGLVWTVNQKGGVIKLLYGTAFKAPNFSQLYNQNNPALVGNSDLDPEVLESIELVYSDIFAEKLQTNLSFYRINTEDLIEVSEDARMVGALPVKYYVNKGETKINGVEFDVKFAYAEKSYLYASYQYTDAEDELSESDVPWVAENQGTLGWNQNFIQNYNLNFAWEYTGERPRELGDPREDIDAYDVFNLTLSANFEKWRIYFSAFNLFDEEVVSPSPLASYPQDDLPLAGDQYSVGASCRF